MEACALALQSEDLSKKERRRKEKRSQRHEHWLAGPGQPALRAEEGRSVFCFYNFRLSCGCVPEVLRVGFF